ncbi:patatin-like phospholipase family protein [Marinobacterium sp. D7]|uniref:patatin-like phospholipase family protein n=1 Tax=Marinobacterium ramblicola TaxID=2849041 RepID=UPI001C2D1285|nr:patatin-like phospholipase family protein [Marinobacterium ramblicola]MBV1788012.1 patatin-like phospholipase family protein [Marinobacterium ramblicola]
MSDGNPSYSNPNYSNDFERVKAEELRWIEDRRRAAGVDPEQPVTGLAFSGGGIRSACFQLGILQGLSENGWIDRIDYLSSVSGGGYMAGCYQWLKHRGQGVADLFSAPVLNWLRAHASYMLAGKGASSATLVAGTLASTLFSLFVLLPILLAGLWVAGLPHTRLPWPKHWHLPGADVIYGHSGYLLMLFGALVCFIFFLISVPTMALWRASHGGGLRYQIAVRGIMGRLIGLTIALVLLGSLPMVSQLDDSLLSLAASEQLAGLGSHLDYVIPLITGVWAMAKARMSPKLALFGLTLLLYGMAAFSYHLVFHLHIADYPLFWSWFGLAVCLATLASVNRTSIHSYYLAQLVQAFFYTGKPVAEDMPLADLKPNKGAPLPLINTTLSTVNSNRSLARSRMGDSFALTPLYCGNPATGFAHTAAFQSGRLSLGDAVTTSGAAVDPDTAKTANRALSILLTMLNFRLGFWVQHPRRAGLHQSHMPFWLIFKELFAKGMNETARSVHLSDGGHFENLGVYELLRRECPLIIASDAGADPQNTLSDLGSLLQRSQADFGCHIALDTKALREVQDGVHQSCFALGIIRYRSGHTGRLLYVKSALTTHSSAQVTCFSNIDAGFPNDSTANQFFDERHLDAYRELGRENILMAIKALESEPTIHRLEESRVAAEDALAV